MGYNNFSEAWAGYLTDDIAAGNASAAATPLIAAIASAPDWVTARPNVVGALTNIKNAAYFHARFGFVDWTTSAHAACLQYAWSEGAGVDMDGILSAMLVATFDQLQKFIGIVDAYRVALWNAPFNADFYAALARGFQTWP